MFFTLNSLAPIRVWAGMKNSQYCRPKHNYSHKQHHHCGAVCPSYGVVSLDTPDRMRATSSERVGQEPFSLV
jgi:hypothetical protein